MQQIDGDEDENGTNTIKVKKGQQMFVRYSPAFAKIIQDLPNKNTVEVEG